MKSILCFGDSNTYGLIPGTFDRYGFEERWTGIISERFREKNYRIIEEGLCGRTTVFDDPLRSGRKGTELLPVLLESHKPLDLVVVMLGTNDCKAHYEASLQMIGLGIKKLIKQIKNVYEEAKVLIVSPIFLGEDIWDGYDMEFDKKSVQTSKELGKIYKKIALTEGAEYLAASEYAVPSLQDREHLDLEGHKSLANAIGDKIEKIFQ